MNIGGGAGGKEGNESVFDKNKVQRERHATELDAEATAVSSSRKKLQTAIAKDQLYRETEVYACIYPHVALLKERNVVKLVGFAKLQSETD